MLYTTVAKATAYHEARLSKAEWSNLSDEVKSAAIQEASDAMDAYAAANGGWIEEYSETTIPDGLSNICATEALSLTREDIKKRFELQGAGVRSTTIGRATEVYSEGSRGKYSSTMLTPGLEAILDQYLRKPGGMVAIV